MGDDENDPKSNRNPPEDSAPHEPGKSELQELDSARPVDFSFKKLKTLAAFDVEQARSTRIGRVPEKGSNRKFLSRAVWLNNNKLSSIEKLNVFLGSILEYPEKLGWIDLSFNNISKIDTVLYKYPNLKIIYFHANKIGSYEEVKKLAVFGQLRSVTFHGNPIADNPHYRGYILAYLPQVCNLDFTPVTKGERYQNLPAIRDDQ